MRRNLASIPSSRLGGEALIIEVFTDPNAALDRCEDMQFDLLVSDYRMPEMSGVEFLARSIASHPNTPRVIVSGFADRDAIIAAINEAQLTRFIEKPWVDAELQRIVVAILTSQGGRIAGKFAAEASAQRERDRLEQESPGITEVDWNPDGSISIDPD
ncbi:MAG TPA: response regulator [Thermomonas sp.]|uniref:response regulator n=2 Tax=Thermomonas sp. TaxID=1971895 RepID=UPI002C7A8483|nr:response regulator [Thermomonas sp.]MBS0458718.1 response regulator [Pseudomonadota bacterium]HOC11594.1 response regulator [Thermomonas sp.]HQA02730.1 response regulator [Thermomonas sp.]